MIAPVTNASPFFLTRVEVADTDYTVTQTNGLLIAYTSLTASRVINLPASSASIGQIIQIVDETGSCSPAIYLTLVPNGTDSINGKSALILNFPYASTSIENNGAGKWSVVSPNTQPQPPVSVTKEVTGFSDPENTVVTYDPVGRTITLTGNVAAYYQGALVSVLVPGWVSTAHPNTNGSWFLYFNGTSFVWQTTPWTFDQLMIAYVHYGATNKFALRECHGMMPYQAHFEFHNTTGTWRLSGGGMSSYVLASTTLADRRPAVAMTQVVDEDIISDNAALTAGGPYTQYYLTGIGTHAFVTGATDIVPLSGSQPYWNQYTASWGQTLMANNSYMTVWLVAAPASADTGSQGYRYFWVQGQTNGTLASEQALQISNLNLGDLTAVFTEFVPVGRVIIQYTAGNWSIAEADLITGTRVSATTSPSGSALTSVSHDTSLTGAGTPGSLLGVATTGVAAGTYNNLTVDATGRATGGTNVAYQAPYTNLTSIGSLANAAGWLYNNGSGTFTYSTPPITWGSITGAAAQAAPSGGWTGTMAMQALTATSASLTGSISVAYANPDIKAIIISATTTTNAVGMKFNNGGGNYYIGSSNSTGGRLFGGGAYSLSIGSESAVPLVFATNNTMRLSIDGSTGAASFGSNSVSMGALTATTTKTSVYTVATLPTGSDGLRAFVSDATATTFASTVVGGGTNHVPVYYDGGSSSWKVG